MQQHNYFKLKLKGLQKITSDSTRLLYVNSLQISHTFEIKMLNEMFFFSSNTQFLHSTLLTQLFLFSFGNFKEIYFV